MRAAEPVAPDRIVDRIVDVVVIGAGINGLCTARELALRGQRVALIERGEFLHSGGSSHGQSRITRSSYAAPHWVRLMQAAHRQCWPELEQAAGEPLIFRRDGCFFGPEDGMLAGYADAIAAVQAEIGGGPGGVDVVPLTTAEAAARFPFRFLPGDRVLWDRTGGVIAAAAAMRALLRLCAAAGVRLVERCEVREIRAGAAMEVVTEAGVWSCGQVAVCAGPWVGRLVPAAAPHLRVWRQTVCYYDAPRADALPVWVWLGREPGAFFYGLPAFGRPGAKLAWHRSTGKPDDPEDDPDDPGQDETAEADRFAAERVLPDQAAPRIATERCLFTMTADDRFLLGPHPEEPRLLLGAACSGHGFKLGPLTGRVLAELATAGRSTIAAFEDNRGRFAIPETPT